MPKTSRKGRPTTRAAKRRRGVVSTPDEVVSAVEDVVPAPVEVGAQQAINNDRSSNPSSQLAETIVAAVRAALASPVADQDATVVNEVENDTQEIVSVARIHESLPTSRPGANSGSCEPSSEDVVATLRDLLHSSLSSATRSMYKRSWAVFHEFYLRYYNTYFSFPVVSSCIALFISYLCAKGLAPATINSYLSAISYVHKMRGFPDPCKTFVIDKLRVALARRSKADIRLPISKSVLHHLVAALTHTAPSAYQRSLYTSMFLLAFYGFFRVGELACKQTKQLGHVVSFETVTFLMRDKQIRSINITITSFKHNLSNRPFKIIIDKQPSEQYCPVQCLINYLKLRGYSAGPLFTFANSDPVTVTQFNKQLRLALSFCGLDTARYKSHSFRIGAACHAAERGFTDAQIRSMGRWKSEAFRSYIRPPSLTTS